MPFATTYKLYSKLCIVGAGYSWVMTSPISYTQSAPVFIKHLCLMKLPVSCYHYVQFDATHVRSVLYCLLSGHRTYGNVTFVHWVSACARVRGSQKAEDKRKAL